MLEAFHMRCLRQILGISWQDHVTFDEIFRRTNSSSMEAILARRHLRWLGHAIRMPPERLSRQVLHGQLLGANRPAGGPNMRFKKCNIPPTALENLAVNRPAWRAAAFNGAKVIESSLSSSRTARRQQRLQQPVGIAIPGALHPCDECNKICASRIGLHAHLQWHRR